MTKAKVRTRNAPSPTGIPHIGNTRTALFDYLLAKKYKGSFVLRIEDTDQKRQVKGAVEAINDIHEFLGLVPDESSKVGGPYAPYTQTERLGTYKKVVKQLIDNGDAYEDEGAVRIKMPKEGYTVWKDLVQGKISIPNEEVDDKVLLKSDGVPTYHLAAMVDDHFMEITHIMRGVEYIVSTPVHLKIYESLGWQPPVFMHVPLLLGPDKSKLSKRHGAKNVLQFKEEGYLPEAINNFLFYLGFSYKDNSDLLTMKEMIDIFDENKISKSNAIFDIQKLNYFNSKWIKKLEGEDLLKRLIPFVKPSYKKDKKKLTQILPLVKDRLTKLNEANDLIDFFFQFEKPDIDSLLESSQASPALTLSWFNMVQNDLEALVEFDPESIHKLLKKTQELSDLSPRQAFMSLRLAITAKDVTPPLFDCISILGKEESLKRLKDSMTSLK
jgi:glutamyl-tRNA synthetase